MPKGASFLAETEMELCRIADERVEEAGDGLEKRDSELVDLQGRK